MNTQITLDSLATRFDGLAIKVDNLASALENLAIMVKQGFEEAEKRSELRFRLVEGRLDRLEQGQDEVRIRLDQAAYRFELVELTHRVKTIENQVGLANG